MGYSTGFPYDSVLVEITSQNLPRGDRDASSDAFRRRERARYTDGVINGDNPDACKVVPLTGMRVAISPGMMVVMGADFEFDNDLESSSFTLANGGANPRIDRIVATHNTHIAVRNLLPERLAGVPGDPAIAPSLTRDISELGEIWQLSLARILVPPGATDISQCTIIDERADDAVCGYSKARRPFQDPQGEEGVTFNDLDDVVTAQSTAPAAAGNRIWIHT